jgi:hypothetical protein
MILIFASKKIEDSPSVIDSFGAQVVIGHAKDGLDQYVCVIDTAQAKAYLMKLLVPSLVFPFTSSNFSKIENDEEFHKVFLFFSERGLFPIG